MLEGSKESNRAATLVTNLESGILLNYSELIIAKPCKHITEIANNLHFESDQCN